MHWYHSLSDYRQFERNQQGSQLPSGQMPQMPDGMSQQTPNPMQHVGSGHRDPRVTSKVARHGTVITSE